MDLVKLLSPNKNISIVEQNTDIIFELKKKFMDKYNNEELPLIYIRYDNEKSNCFEFINLFFNNDDIIYLNICNEEIDDFVFIGAMINIKELIEDLPFCEFILFSKNYEKIIMDTHHDMLIFSLKSWLPE